MTTSLNPPILHPETLDVARAEYPWYVAYCLPRQEKALARELAEREVPYFLPMVQRETSSGGRRRRNLYPLFPSYLFFTGDEVRRLAALRTERIVRLVEVADIQQDRLRRELAQLAAAIVAAPDRLELHPRLVPGTVVEIRSGPLAGLEGVVLNADNKKKLWLGITALGTGATVEIHADLVG